MCVLSANDYPQSLLCNKVFPNSSNDLIYDACQITSHSTRCKFFSKPYEPD